MIVIKERFIMKRLGAVIVSLAVTLGITAGVYAATPSSVKVSGSGTNAKTVTYQYTSGKEASKPVTNIMTEPNNLTKKKMSVTQVITLTSESADNSPVEFKLRLVTKPSATPTPTPKTTPTATPDVKNSVLGVYNITVRDSAGKIVGESKSGEEDLYVSEKGIVTRDIDLGILNKQSSKETKIYNIEVSINGDETAWQLNSAKKQIQWEIVSGPVPEATPSPTPDENAEKTETDTPKESSAPEITMTPVPQSTPSVTETPAPTEKPSPSPTAETYKNGGTKYVGNDKDIKPGRYVATGNGMVKVYNENDELKTSILLTDGKDNTENGVDSYVLSLADGQKLEYSDYINLKPYTTATATPKASENTNTSSATTAPKSGGSDSDSSKSNPKTGDSTPIAGLSVVMVFALGMAVFMEISRRKED